MISDIILVSPISYWYDLSPEMACSDGRGVNVWVKLWTVIGRGSLEGMFEVPHGPCGVPITLVHSHSDFPKRSYQYDLTAGARHLS